MEQLGFDDRRNAAASYDPMDIAEPASNRREHSRHMSVMRVARLSNQSIGVEGLGVVRNISSGGMMIDARIPIATGHILTVSMLDDQCVTGEVVWQDGASIGLKFNEQADVSSLLSRPSLDHTGRRVRLPRLAIDRLAKAQTDTLCFEVQLCDLSQRGAKLSTPERLTPHTQILLTLAECRSVRGTVRWRQGAVVGVEFHRFLGVDELAQWLAGSGAE